MTCAMNALVLTGIGIDIGHRMKQSNVVLHISPLVDVGKGQRDNRCCLLGKEAGLAVRMPRFFGPGVLLLLHAMHGPHPSHCICFCLWSL